MPRFTLYGFYQFDPTLFNDAIMPEGINKTDLVLHIMERCGDLYPYYQTAPRLKSLITLFFRRNRENYNRIWTALAAEYSPIENYDRYEDILRKTARSGEDVNTLAAGTTIETEFEGTNENFTAPYPATTYTGRGKDESGNTTTTEHSGQDVNTMAYGGKEDESVVSHLHGNIGVTTNMAMIEEEILLRRRFNLYDIIAQDFEREFIVQIY